jgi:hypothetical protein
MLAAAGLAADTPPADKDDAKTVDAVQHTEVQPDASTADPKSEGGGGSKVQRAAWLAYGLGIAWFLLLPAVTISTGELKPRGIYYDENALLVS